MSVKDAFDYVDLEEYQQNEQYLDWGFAEEDVLPGLHNSEYFDESDTSDDEEEQEVVLPVEDMNVNINVPVEDIPIQDHNNNNNA